MGRLYRGAPLWIIKFLLKFQPHQRQVLRAALFPLALVACRFQAAARAGAQLGSPNELGGWVLVRFTMLYTSTSILFSASVIIWICFKIKRVETTVLNKRRHSWVRASTKLLLRQQLWQKRALYFNEFLPYTERERCWQNVNTRT